MVSFAMIVGPLALLTILTGLFYWELNRPKSANYLRSDEDWLAIEKELDELAVMSKSWEG